MESKDLLKIEEEKVPSQECLKSSFSCGTCDHVSASMKEWEEHRINVHKFPCVAENEAELYKAPKQVGTRIIGQMEAELHRSGIQIGIYDIIELDLATLE